MESALLQTKLNPPPIRQPLVHRPQLIDNLNLGLQKQLTLISAPAGFGKSTLASSWLTGQTNGAWLALDAGDNEPRVFWQYVVAAIQSVLGDFGQEAAAYLQSQQVADLKPVLVNLINELSVHSGPLTLVLEDYHLIDSREVHDSLSFFLEHKPPTTHLMLLTRVDPPLALGRLRANDDLCEIRSADLQFSLNESADFFGRVMNLELTPEMIASLNDRTEGWVAGLQMAGLSLQGLESSEQVEAFIKDFRGSHRHVFDYLTDEVLAHQSPETQIFLLQTSILDQFNASLCNTVTGHKNSQEILEALENANLFLFRLDENRRWYRYHHLFATLLQRRLKLQPGHDPEILHQRAAEWFESQRSFDLAVKHLQAANNQAGMARLIKQYGADSLQPGQFDQLQRWLNALPEQTVQDDPTLAGLQAWIYFFEQQTDQAAVWVAYAKQALGNDGEQSHQTDSQAWGTIIGLQSWIAAQRGDLHDATHFAQEALEKLPPTAHIWRGINHLLLADALAGSGRTSEAVAAWSMSLQYGHPASNAIAATAITGAIWITKVLRGRLNEAREQLDLVIEQVTGLGQSFNTATLRTVRAAILYEQNELTAMHAELSDIWNFVQFDSTIANVRHHYLAARYYIAVDDRENAMQSVRQLEDGIENWQTPDEKARAVADIMRLYLRLGERSKPAAWLETVQIDPDNLTLVRLDEYLAFADVLRFAESTQDREEGLQFLEVLHKLCDEAEIHGIKIEVFCLEALLMAANEEAERALSTLGEGLARGKPEKYVRTFVDFGEPMSRLLEKAADEKVYPDYARFLLSQFPARLKPRTETRTSTTLIDPLSDRELDVLQLLATHHTGPEIAGELHISLNTLKTHTKNIYGKLGANSRSEAVTAARNAGLL